MEQLSNKYVLGFQKNERLVIALRYASNVRLPRLSLRKIVLWELAKYPKEVEIPRCHRYYRMDFI